MKRIFITGCSRSGTTLLKRLFYAFPSVGVHKAEISLDSFSGIPNHLDCIAYVGKRKCKTVFSNVLPQAEIDLQLKLIREREILVVNIIRGRTAVTEAKDWPVPVDRYNAAITQAGIYCNHIAYETNYETLISEPDLVQGEIAERLIPEVKKFGYQVWSDYPEFVPPDEFADISDPRYAPRPIGQSMFHEEAINEDPALG